MPLDSLCICPGKAVYVLYIDVVCINYDGNAFDAAVMAVMAALRNSQNYPVTNTTTQLIFTSPAASSSLR